MITTEGVFLALLLPGVLLLVASLLVTRLHWRTDITPYGRGTPHLQVMLHPEQYTKDAPVRAIRILSAAGAVLLAGAVFVVTYELVRTSSRR